MPAATADVLNPAMVIVFKRRAHRPASYLVPFFIAGRFPRTFAHIIAEFGGLHETRMAVTRTSLPLLFGCVCLCPGRKNHVGRRHHRIPAREQWASHFALPRSIEADNHGQRYISRGLTARRLRRDGNGSPARAFAVQRVEKSSECSEGTPGPRITSERDYMVRSHQLLRNFSGLGRQPRMGSGSGSRPHGEFFCCPERPR